MGATIFWDFDGTLAHRPSMFSRSLVAVFDEREPGHGITADSLATWLHAGFPWHEPETDHRFLATPEAWWAHIYRLFEAAFERNGVPPGKAARYAREARKHLVDAKYYSLYPDALDALKYFRGVGYANVILSNHLPELPDICEALGLMEHVEICISSANVGFEKPNPEFFRIALEMAGKPAVSWMVGDNLGADVRGAEACGMKAVLVRRRPDEPVAYFSPALAGLADIIPPNR